MQYFVTLKRKYEAADIFFIDVENDDDEIVRSSRRGSVRSECGAFFWADKVLSVIPPNYLVLVITAVHSFDHISLLIS